MELKYIEKKKIKKNPSQPRINFDKEKLKELEESISEHGLIQPIVVRKIKNGYELIVGERRFKSFKGAKIPALIKNVTDQEQAIQGLIENIHRADLSQEEKAGGFQAFKNKYHLASWSQ